MWTVWSLENDLVTRRLHEDPGIIEDGGTNALLGSLDRVWNPEESGDSRIRSGDRGLNPEVSVIGPGGQSYYAFEGVLEPGGLDPESLVGTRRFFEVVMTPMRPRLHRGVRTRTRSSLGTRNVLFFAGTVLRLPRQVYYRYLFGFRILPLGSWPLSSSYAVFYFCRKSLTGLEGAGVGVMTQVPGLRCFPRLEKQDLDCFLYFTVLLQCVYTMCSLYRVARSVLIHVVFTLVLWGPRCALGCTAVLGSFDSILRLAHTHSCFMSHTRFDSLWACHSGHATFVRVGQDRRSLET
ncbi:hypothetical protein DY000_02014426 [Brassica cretica]|uniref:Uncharacterized protein n=1 Tax=Brassica cretica TaxID=69181 RepID=A0ABQ7CQ65_BRACR|nr:hypothetical protein DY000_02014426 [Brassica cretica]